MIEGLRSNINLSRRQNYRTVKTHLVQSTSEAGPVVGESIRVLPNSSKRASVTDNVFSSEYHSKKSKSTSLEDEEEEARSIQIGTHRRPRVQTGIKDSSATILLVCQIGYTILHTTLYIVGLAFWNVFTPYYIVIWFLEEIPNTYNIAITFFSQLDPVIPTNIYDSSTQVQRILYLWKPVVNVLALVVLALDLLPLGFGFYIWYFGDGTTAQSIGQTTIIEALAPTFLYLYSLVLLWLTMTWLKRELNMKFAGYRAPGHQIVQHPKVTTTSKMTRSISSEHWTRLSQHDDMVEEEYQRTSRKDDESSLSHRKLVKGGSTNIAKRKSYLHRNITNKKKIEPIDDHDIQNINVTIL